MSRRNVLYISGSVGLGHVTRDLAIARELRRQVPGVEISWLAAHPATAVLKQEGENLLPEAELCADDSKAAEAAAKEGFRLNLVKYLLNAVGEWRQNVEAFRRAIARVSFDVVVADEAYEISAALAERRVQTDCPFVMIFDFFGNVPTGWSPIGRLMTHMCNRQWSKCRSFYADRRHIALFVGQVEDVPDRRLGLLLPNARQVAREVCEFTGYALSFDPTECADKSRLRSELGYGKQPLIVCSIGGTCVGKELLDLCGQAYCIIRGSIPNVQMVMVCGPRLDAKSLCLPKGVQIRGYVPRLYRHFAACDLAIVQGGGTSTLELTALRRPFLYFPLDGHFEQEVHVARRLARHGAGIKMCYRETTPDGLAAMALSHIGSEVDYPAIQTDGARKAAEVIAHVL
jgi:predicted glycosyltransferase